MGSGRSVGDPVGGALPAALVLALLAVLLAGCAADELVAAVPPPPLPPPREYGGPWPEMKDAKIRPGVQVLTPQGQALGACTSNFLFRKPDNRTLLLGLAAHCFGTDPSQTAANGTAVVVAGIPNAGKVAYNGWAKQAEPDNDCGFVALSNSLAVRSRVHPAVLHFGGPLGLAASDEVLPGKHVVTYGNSPQRSPTDGDNPREGYVLQKEAARTVVVTDPPGIQGDSGSGLMTSDGRALGVLSMGTTNPAAPHVANRDFPSVNYYVDLDKCLQRAAADAPWLADIELVTWRLLQPAQLPDVVPGAVPGSVFQERSSPLAPNRL